MGIALKVKLFMPVVIRFIYFTNHLYLKIGVCAFFLSVDTGFFIVFFPACPQLHGSVLIAGLAIMAIASLLSLAYVFIMGK